MGSQVAAAIIASVLIAVAAAFAWFYLRRVGRTCPVRDYAARRNWTRSRGSLNYSSFVYLDVDRDGHYGVDDRPMAGITVRLSGEKGPSKTAITNSNGFANFKTSTTKRRASIRKPGTYKFAVSVPPGFESTSGNEVQSKVFRLIAGSPSGLGTEGMVQPVGLAPIRNISGYLAVDAVATISASRAETVLFLEKPEPGRHFRFQASDEADTVTVAGRGLGRTLTLSPYPLDLGLLSMNRRLLDAAAPTEIIDFEDVSRGNLRKIPSGYAGLNWFNLNALSRDSESAAQGYINGNTSGHHMCYTSSGHPAEIWRDRPFGFHSVMLCAAWLQSEGETALVESWSGDRLVARDQVVLSALTPLHYAPMLGAVTRIRISSEHYWQIVLDDLRLAR